jgi:hypothetical protein
MKNLLISNLIFSFGTCANGGFNLQPEESKIIQMDIVVNQTRKVLSNFEFNPNSVSLISSLENNQMNMSKSGMIDKGLSDYSDV